MYQQENLISMGIEMGPFLEDIYALSAELSGLIGVNWMQKYIHA